jgi:peptidoglycan hydrolase-like protein with peptidoglycan-binding domain
VSRARRTGAAVVAAAVTAAGFVAGGLLHRGRAASPGPAPVATAVVRRTNLAATQLVDATLGYAPAPPVLLRRTGTYTGLPTEGTVVLPGQALARIDDRPVVLLTGAVAAWRPFGLGMTDGPDVEQFERGLASLGFGRDLRPDRHFTVATDAAVRRWQAALGEPVTGVVADGDVLFEPSALRVGHLTAAVGGPAQPGQSPYAAESTRRVVHAALDTSRRAGVTAGLAVVVDLPDGTKVPGKVAAVGRVASSPSGDVGSGGPGGADRPTVPLDVALDDPHAGGDLDEVPVAVELVTDFRRDVLAVPVTALLALAEGGYGVEVVPPAGPHRIAAVTAGLFASGFVEVAGRELPEGTVVAVAR